MNDSLQAGWFSEETSLPPGEDANRIRGLEELSLNAWPSHKQELYDGWLIRFSHNYTHRTNCVEQIAESRLPVEEKISYCESVYRSLFTPVIFKISPLLYPGFDSMLEERGYRKEHVNETMVMEEENFRPWEPTDVEYEFYGRNSGLPSITGYPGGIIVQLRDRITEDWIDGLFRLNGTTNPTLLRIVPSMYHAIPKETIAAKVEMNGRMVATGLGILDRGYAGIYAMYVDPGMRGKHLGKAILSTLLIEAAKKGYKKAYLQCVKGNNTAKSLYESTGFRAMYSCWFRVHE